MQGLLAIALLLAVAAACAAALRLVQCTAWAILGGVMAGFLLGPTLLGRVVPAAYEGIFVGGVEQRQELQQLHGRHGADLLAAQHAGLDLDTLQEMRQVHDRERAVAEAALRDARWEHQLPQRSLAVVLIVTALLGARWMAHERRNSTRQRLVRTSDAMTIGMWSATVSGAAALLVGIYWWGLLPAEAALVAAAVIIGPWALTRVDRIAAERSERGGSALIERAGRFATLVSLLVAGWALWSMHGVHGLLWLLPLLAVVAHWLNAVSSLHIREALHSLVLPALAASVAVKIELIHHFAFWPLLVLLILSGDGRWLGAVIGTLLLGGRDTRSALRVSLGAMACGPTQLAVIAIAAHAWLLDESLLLALLAGVVYVEASVPMRRWFAFELGRAMK